MSTWDWLRGVGGHSHGAFHALAYALSHPDRVEGVLYLSGTGLQNDRSWHQAYDAGLDAGLDRDCPPDSYTVNREVNAAGSRDFKEFVRRPGLWRQVGGLSVPLRAVHGGRDIRPLWPVEQLVELVPDGRLDVIPEAPHDLWFTHTAQTGELMRGYLEELATS